MGALFRRKYGRKLTYLVLSLLAAYVLLASLRPGYGAPEAPLEAEKMEPDSVDDIPDSVDDIPDSVDDTPDSVDDTPGLVEQTDKAKTPKLSKLDKTISESKTNHKKEKSNSEHQDKEEKAKEDLILRKMEKSMLKEVILPPPKNLLRPEIMLRGCIGPVHYKEEAAAPAPRGSKLLVVARDNSGFPVLQQFFNPSSGFFQHGDTLAAGDLGRPVTSAAGDLGRLANLLNCVLDPDTVLHFGDVISGEFGRTPYFREECLLESGTVCTDPLSYERTCAKYRHQVLRTKQMGLDLVEVMMTGNKDVKVIFLVRDPRAGLADKSVSEITSYCSRLGADLDRASALERKYAGQFATARFEVLAGEPRNETLNLLRSLQIDHLVRLEPSAMIQSDEGWSSEKNSLSKINSWKQKLTMKEIKKIETQCTDTITRLEYPLLDLMGFAG